MGAQTRNNKHKEKETGNVRETRVDQNTVGKGKGDMSKYDKDKRVRVNAKQEKLEVRAGEGQVASRRSARLEMKLGGADEECDTQGNRSYHGDACGQRQHTQGLVDRDGLRCKGGHVTCTRLFPDYRAGGVGRNCHWANWV